MASTLAFVIVLSVVAATFSLPISLDVKTVQLTDSENPSTLKTPVIGAELTLSAEEEIKHVRTLTTETVLNVFEDGETDRSRRVRRDITKPKVLCPGDMIQVGNICLTSEQYDDNNY